MSRMTAVWPERRASVATAQGGKSEPDGDRRHQADEAALQPAEDRLNPWESLHLAVQIGQRERLAVPFAAHVRRRLRREELAVVHVSIARKEVVGIHEEKEISNEII